MPYKNVPAELFMEYKGVKVFNTYLDNDIDNEKLMFMYVTKPDDEVEDAVDLRALPVWENIVCPEFPIGFAPTESKEPDNNDFLWELWKDVDHAIFKEALKVAINKQYIS